VTIFERVFDLERALANTLSKYGYTKISDFL